MLLGVVVQREDWTEGMLQIYSVMSYGFQCTIAGFLRFQYIVFFIVRYSSFYVPCPIYIFRILILIVGLMWHTAEPESSSGGEGGGMVTGKRNPNFWENNAP
jgi:hypothetical protein